MPVPYTKDLMQDEIARLGYEVGDYSYGRPIVLNWGEGTKLFIGKYCSIADGVTVFLGGNHRVDWITTYPFSSIADTWPEGAGIAGCPATKGDVRIENDVWLGAHATLMSGITIGNGAVVGAYAVVTKNVPPYAMVAGNPARLIRYRFKEAAIKQLLELRWWNWPETHVRMLIPYLVSNDVGRFLSMAQAIVEAHIATSACDLDETLPR